ncbi:MAG TPA: oxaloacetate-decarboxylating malate dehydrogenase, partial [Streptosporangiaceae bacterium]|nr:oxaloacetate-decarboxylating malate dehydrogenase [Streptosporangiaceae bacterium]
MGTTTRTPAVPGVLQDPVSNRGVAFSQAERDRLGLTGRLPSAVLTLDQQALRAYQQLQRQPSDLAKNVYLEQLHDRNETLYYRVLSDHLAELLPVVYDPTVGDAIEKYSHEYRRPRGIFLSIDQPDEIARAFATLELGPDDVDLIVCTDAEEILGIGDWGVGGIQIAVGKLAVYTAAAGIDPDRVIPVSLDVGTDNEELLNDPLYLGSRHARVRGAAYDAFIAKYLQTASSLFPDALLHFEDFGPGNARRILVTYQDKYRIFNDDMQGTGAITLAATLSAVKVTGVPMREQKLLVFGAGTAGVGIADQLHDAMVRDGATKEQATAQVWLVDKQGLLTSDMTGLRDYQQPYARNPEEVTGWAGSGGTISLLDAVR